MNKATRVARAVMIGLMLGLAGTAVVASEPERTVEAWVADLASPEFEVRNEASAALLKMESLGLPEIEGLLKAKSMNPEQRARLLALAKERFVKSPRAAIGVSFSNTASNTVSQVHAGFPAAGVLMPGDSIRAVNGVEVVSEDVDAFVATTPIRPYIISNDPGESVRMLVQRKGRLQEMMVPLGRYNDLERVQPQMNGQTALKPEELDAAWQVRVTMRGLRANDGAKLAVPIAVTEGVIEQLPLMMREEALREAGDAGLWAPVAGGGQTTRSSAESAREQLAAAGQGNWLNQPRVIVGPGNVIIQGPGVGPGAVPGRVAALDRLQQLATQHLQQHATLEKQIAAIDTESRGEGVTDARREELKKLREKYSDAMVQLDRELTMVKQQIAQQMQPQPGNRRLRP